MTAIQVGDIVTVTDDDAFLRRKQGLVTGVQLRLWELPLIAVYFHQNVCPHVPFDVTEIVTDPGMCLTYSEAALTVNPEWEPKTAATMHFGDRWNIVQYDRTPLNPARPCVIEDCPRTQTHVAWFNCWGTVVNIHVCAVHMKMYHRVYGDSIPFRAAA